MADDNSDDWLPPGWRMDVRLRKFGRKDKHYYAPSGQKFFSKLEVLRHLKNNLPPNTPQLEERKDGRVSSSQSRGNKEVSLHQGAVDACNNGDSSSPTSVEKGKSSPDISTYFSCNSMDSSSLASGEENQVIEQNVEIHYGGTPNIGCLLPKDGIIDTYEAAMPIARESPANKLQSEENGILHPSLENHCAKKLEEDSAPKEAWAFALNLSSVGETGRAEQSGSPTIIQKRNSRHQDHAKTKVVVEKCVGEGLPEGWTKEIKATKKNGSVRRDPYYTDPVGGYVFPSMKDVRRYLKTGDIGRLAFKSKDKISGHIELEDEETPVRQPESSLSKKQKLAETCSSDNKEGIEDFPEKVLFVPSSSHMEEASLPECPQHESKGCSSRLFEAVRLEHSEEKDNCSRKNIFSVPEASVISEEPLQKKWLRRENDECGACTPGVTLLETTLDEGTRKNYEPCCQNVTQIKNITPEILPATEESKDTIPTSNVKEKATRKPRRIKEINMPRRTSCRLAGIAVDPTVEIPSRASWGNAKHIGWEGPSQVKPEIQSTEVLRVGVDSNCTASDKDTPDRNSALIGVATPNVDNGSMENKMVEKRVLPFVLPSPEILQDPCIEFAIKTLTGVIDFINLDHAFQPSNGMTSKSADCSGANSESEKHGSQDPGVRALVSSKEPSLPEEPIVKPITEETAADTLSSSLLGGSWSDPCIEFAIKTLTGAIPLDYSVGVQDISWQEMHSPQIPGSNGLVLTGLGADNFCRTDLLWQHNDATAENPMYRGRDGLMPQAPVDLPRSRVSVGHRQLPDRGGNRNR